MRNVFPFYHITQWIMFQFVGFRVERMVASISKRQFPARGKGTYGETCARRTTFITQCRPIPLKQVALF